MTVLSTARRHAAGNDPNTGCNHGLQSKIVALITSACGHLGVRGTMAAGGHRRGRAGGQAGAAGRAGEVRWRTWTIAGHDGPDHLGLCLRRAPRASNGPDHLGLCRGTPQFSAASHVLQPVGILDKDCSKSSRTHTVTHSCHLYGESPLQL